MSFADWFSAPSLDGLIEEECREIPHNGRCINDLSIRLVPMADHTHLQLVYNSEIFSEGTVVRLMDSVLHILRHATENMQEEPIINVLAIEHRKVLRGFSMGEECPSYVSAPTAHESFAALVAKHPHRPCLCFKGEWLTYGEVNERATLIAAQLSSLHIGPGAVVGLMLDRSFELVISMLGVLKAGGCFLPCDPSYPDNRLAIFLEDSATRVVFAQEQHMERTRRIVSSDVHVIMLGEFERADIDATLDGDNLSGNSEETANRRASLRDPAYIMFTSGSTGRPKGVVISHLALIDFLQYNLEHYGVDKDSVSMLSISINFDPSIMQIFTPLIAGAKLVITLPNGHVNAEYIANLMLEHGITFFNTVPSLGLEYYKQPAIRNCVSLRSAIFSGEAMPMSLVNLVHRNTPKAVKVYNAYGKQFKIKLIWVFLQSWKIALFSNLLCFIIRSQSNDLTL